MSFMNKIIRPFAASLIVSLLLCGCTQSFNASNHLNQSQIRVIPKESIKQTPVNDKHDSPAQLRVPFPPIPDESENSSKEIQQ